MSRVFTIGYEGLRIEDFLSTLGRMEIRALADVRALPLSRKPGFSKNALRAALDRVGIRYLSFRSLGDPKEGRDAARAGKMAKFRAVYTAHLEGIGAKVALEELAGLALSTPTCLLCFERDPEVCHRLMITDRLTAFHLQAQHIIAPLATEPFDYRVNVARRHSRQGTAAA
ncbi:MAG: DUF488 domain-containing protein [Bauldia sp.]|nr:DUF488 domain-containing protein [Bauldia sp.]MCW5716297.1 DUF488 domain-containing protein [Bauldia sp.]